MAGQGCAVTATPVLECLEPRILLDARPLAELLAELPGLPAQDTTERFGWSGFAAGALLPGEATGQALAPVAALGAASAWATLEYHFPEQVRLEPAAGGFWLFADGEEPWVRENDPVVPVRESHILLPPGSRILSVEVDLGPGIVVGEGVGLLALGQPVPLYDGAPLELDYVPRLADSSFPAAEAVTFSTQTMCGYSIGVLSVFPARYDAATGTVTYYPNITVTIATGPAPGAALSVRNSVEDLHRVLSAVDNDSAAVGYLSVAPAGGEAPAAGALPAGGPYEYVIVTSAALAGEFQALIDHKRSRGLTAAIVTTQYIYGSYTSPYANENDNAGKVRAFLADAYATWQTRYVLLGGDVSQVPYRKIHVECSSYVADLASDMYFACLDGPYNYDGDARWGESTDGTGGKEVDLLAELAVGRAPVDNAAEARNFIAKTIYYETTPRAGAYSTLLIGENLQSTSPVTWGGDACDYIAQQVFPAGMEITRLYAKTGTFSGSAVRSALNAGAHLVHHVGHSTSTSNAGLSRSDVDNLANAEPYLFYSQGCLAGQFENEDAIAEHHLKALRGAVAVVMNSHYGWYLAGSPSASGTQWGLAFWDALFTENILPVGDVHMDAKTDRVGTISAANSDRWLFFASTLFGDPETHVYLPRDGGPRVLSHSPPTAAATGEGVVRLRFNEPMDTGSFSPAEDIVSFTGPGGYDMGGWVVGYAWRDFFTLDVLVRAPLPYGDYELVLGPDILDAGGTPLNQDGDGTPGEPVADRYRARFSIAGAGRAQGVIYAADMSEDPGWTLDSGQDDWRWAWGFPSGAAGDPTGGYTGSGVLGYNLNGAYPNRMFVAQYATTPPIDCRGFRQVTLSFWQWLRVRAAPGDNAGIQVSNDGGATWHQVWSNSTRLEATAWTQQTFDISAVADGQGDVRIRWAMGPTNATGDDGGWNLDDVRITGWTDHPAVIEHSPGGPVAPGLDHVDVTFTVPIDAGTFTVEDISLRGPSGDVAVLAVTLLAGNTFRIRFAPLSGEGAYTISVGPQVANRVGTPMDQDGDGTPGEAGDDAYVGTFEVVTPDTDPPAVASHWPSGQLLAPPGAVRFTFDEEMDAGSFSSADIVSFTGPGGADLRGQIVGYHWLDACTLEVSFLPQGTPGTYEMVIGPDILDDPPGGNPMDQDGNGTPGEPTDTYAARFELIEMDLLGGALAVRPDSLDSGQGMTVATFRILNGGRTAAGPFQVRFYLSDDQHIDPQQDLLLLLESGAQAYDVQGLGPTAELLDSVRLLVPAADTFGTDNEYWIGMVVDSADEVPEIDEANNSGLGVGLDLARAYYGRILGTVWHDTDGDGALLPGEPNLGGQKVFLDLDDNGRRDDGEPECLTDGEGRYVFRYLADGPYTVRLELQPAWLRSCPPGTDAYRITLAPGEPVEGLDFGLCQPAAVSGTVFEDADLDGQQGAGEPPLVARTVFLDLDNSGQHDPDEPIGQTGPDGGYVFQGLRPGQYTICLLAPDGWHLSSPSDGKHAVSLVSGQAAGGRDFGLADGAGFRQGDEVPYPTPGLEYAYYHHAAAPGVDALDALAPQYAGAIAGFDLAARDRDEDYGFIYTGFVTIDQEGIYTFYTVSDDGSRLYVGDLLVVDNDGYHAAAERSGRIGLKAGQHEITVKYLQGAGEQALSVQYEGPGVPKGDLPADRLLYSKEPDVTPPRLSHVAAEDAMHVSVTFDESMEAASAEASGNYRLDHGASVLEASLDGDGRTVRLTLTQTLIDGLIYTLTVSGARDVSGNPIAPDAQATFSFTRTEPDLLTWWTFDEVVGGLAADATGRGHDGLVTGAEWVAEGRIGGALRFHGGSDRVEDDDGGGYLNGLSGLTVAMWLWADAGIIGVTDAGIFTTRSPGDKECVSFRYDAEGYWGGAEKTFKAYVMTDVAKKQIEAGAQGEGWQHVAVTWADGQPIQLYLDGVLQDKLMDEGRLSGTIAQAMTVIVGQGCVADQPWVGLIDDVRIYGRQLGAEEIAALANVDPLAVGDAYELTQDQPLVVSAAEGVLANDLDPDAGPGALAAVLADPPTHGQLALNGDGSFLYTPAAGYTGPDSFTYRVFDGREYSRPAEVHLTVRLPAPTVVSFVRDNWPDRPSELTAVSIRFSQDVSHSLTAQDLRIYNLSTNQAVDLAAATVSYEPATNTARWDLSAVPVQAGYHTLALAAEAVMNADGRPLACQGGQYELTVLVALPGDANLDARVTREDLMILKQHFGQVGAAWAWGDFDYDGMVGLLDYLAVKEHYGTTLLVAPSQPAAAATQSPTEAATDVQPAGQAEPPDEGPALPAEASEADPAEAASTSAADDDPQAPQVAETAEPVEAAPARSGAEPVIEAPLDVQAAPQGAAPCEGGHVPAAGPDVETGPDLLAEPVGPARPAGPARKGVGATFAAPPRPAVMASGKTATDPGTCIAVIARVRGAGPRSAAPPGGMLPRAGPVEAVTVGPEAEASAAGRAWGLEDVLARARRLPLPLA